jgi:hypothetical protein
MASPDLKASTVFHRSLTLVYATTDPYKFGLGMEDKAWSTMERF